MWKISAAFFLCITWLRPAAAQDDPGFAAIRSALLEQQAAWNDGDVDRFMDHYWRSDSLQFIGAASPTYGWQATLEQYRRRFPDRQAMGRLEFDILRLDRRSSTVISNIGKFTLRRETGDLSGYFLLLWQYIDGRWLIVADCTSSSP